MLIGTTRRQVAVGLGLVASFFLMTVHPVEPTASPRHLDFTLYYEAGKVERHGSFSDTRAVQKQAEADGFSVGGGEAFGSPTLIALVFQPLSFVDYSLARAAFYVTTFALIGLAFLRAKPPLAPLWLIVLCASWSFHFATDLGQFSLVTFALLLWSYAGLKRDSAWECAVPLALATAFKIYPVFLIVPLIIKKQWGILYRFGAVLGVFGLITIPALGFADVGPAIAQTIHVSEAKDVLAAQSTPGFIQNRSIPGLASLATESAVVGRILSVLLFGAAIALLGFQRKRSTRFLFAISILLMHLAQPITWDHYLLALLIPLVALAERSPRPVPWACGCLAMAFILGPFNASHTAGDLRALLDVRVLGTLILLASMMYAVSPAGTKTTVAKT